MRQSRRVQNTGCRGPPPLLNAHPVLEPIAPAWIGNAIRLVIVAFDHPQLRRIEAASLSE